MHPRIAEIRSYLESCRSTLAEAVESVRPEHRQTPPDDGWWSVAEILEHLGLVETRIANLLLTQSAGLGRETDVSPILPGMTLERIENRVQRVTVKDAVRPVGNLSWLEAWAALETSRKRLFGALAEIDGLALGDRSVPHQALGNLSLYDWAAFVGAHEVRHGRQIVDVGRQLIQGKAL